MIKDKPKTQVGIRTISITDSLVVFLHKIRLEQDRSLNYRTLVLPNTRYNILTSANSLIALDVGRQVVIKWVLDIVASTHCAIHGQPEH